MNNKILLIILLINLNICADNGDVDITLNKNIPGNPIFTEFGTRGANIMSEFKLNSSLKSVTLNKENKIVAVGSREYDQNGNKMIYLSFYFHFDKAQQIIW